MSESDEKPPPSATAAALDPPVSTERETSPAPENRPAASGPMPVGSISYGPAPARAAADQAPRRVSGNRPNPYVDAPKVPAPSLSGNLLQGGGLMAPLLVAMLLLGLIMLGTAGIMVVKSLRDTRDTVERIGPPPNLGKLPAMSFAVGHSLNIVDIHARLEYDPNIDARVADPFATRIFELVADRLTGVRVEDLRGAAGAQFMKRTISTAVNHEIKPIRVRDVLLDRMIVR